MAGVAVVVVVVVAGLDIRVRANRQTATPTEQQARGSAVPNVQPHAAALAVQLGLAGRRRRPVVVRDLCVRVDVLRAAAVVEERGEQRLRVRGGAARLFVRSGRRRRSRRGGGAAPPAGAAHQSAALETRVRCGGESFPARTQTRAAISRSPHQPLSRRHRSLRTNLNSLRAASTRLSCSMRRAAASRLILFRIAALRSTLPPRGRRASAAATHGRGGRTPGLAAGTANGNDRRDVTRCSRSRRFFAIGWASVSERPHGRARLSEPAGAGGGGKAKVEAADGRGAAKSNGCACPVRVMAGLKTLRAGSIWVRGACRWLPFAGYRDFVLSFFFFFFFYFVPSVGAAGSVPSAGPRALGRGSAGGVRRGREQAGLGWSVVMCECVVGKYVFFPRTKVRRGGGGVDGGGRTRLYICVLRESPSIQPAPVPSAPSSDLSVPRPTAHTATHARENVGSA